MCSGIQPPLQNHLSIEAKHKGFSGHLGDDILPSYLGIISETMK